MHDSLDTCAAAEVLLMVVVVGILQSFTQVKEHVSSA